MAVRLIRAATPWFRVLALSATPGKDVDKVQEVVSNLIIQVRGIRTNAAEKQAPRSPKKGSPRRSPFRNL